MTKSADAFRSIGEVARLLGVAPHVLRYWETQFPMLRPMKRADGRRYYRPEDVRLAAGLCTVLRDEGLTIRGARMLLARDRGAALRERGSDRLQVLLSSLAEDAADDPQDILDDAPADGDEVPAPRARLRRRPPPAARPRGGIAGTSPDLGTLRQHLRHLAAERDLTARDRALLLRLRDVLGRMC